MGGANGNGLALAVDMLTEVLSGAVFGPGISKMYGEYKKYRKLSHTIVAIDPGLFIDKNEFLKNTDRIIDELHNVNPAEGFASVLDPGEPEQHTKEKRRLDDISVKKRIYEYLKTG